MKSDSEDLDKDEVWSYYLKTSGNMEDMSKEERLDIITYFRKLEGYSVVFPRFFHAMKTLEFILRTPNLVYYVYACLCPILTIYYSNDLFICFLMFDIIVNFYH